MHIPTLLLTGATALSLVLADNAFTMSGPYNVVAGTPFNITWASTTGSSDTVSLYLRQGDANDLTTVGTIASSLQNTNSYIWTPSPSLPPAANYALEIVDAEDPALNNYSGQFSIVSSGTASPLASSIHTTLSSLPGTSSSPSQISSAFSSIMPGNSTSTISPLTSGTGYSNATVTSAASSGGGAAASSSAKDSESGSQGVSQSKTQGTGTATNSLGSSTPSGNAGCVVRVPGLGWLKALWLGGKGGVPGMGVAVLVLVFVAGGMVGL